MKLIINYIFVLLLWLAAILMLGSGVFPWLFWVLLGLHFLELLLVGFRTGREYGVGAGKSILMCMLYGYIWWLPLQKQMAAETFTDADFVRET